MNLLSVENISKSYGERILFSDVSFGINEGEKIGLIGVNGTGKSTFLKIIVGAETTDTGRVIKGNTVRIEYLSQNPYFDPDATILQQVFKGNSPIMTVLRAYEELLEKLKHSPNDNDLQNKFMKLNQEMDDLGAWQLESEAKNVLTKLGIYDFDVKVGTLSGGQRKRIALASALISPCDLLVLDEPTNHIDNETIKWLEEYLNKRKGALLMITHDRYFLDRVTNRILEIDGGTLYQYTGNYSTFLQAKSEREELRVSAEKKRKNLYRKELAWIKSGVKARSTKQKARIQRFEKLEEEKINTDEEKMEISVGTRRLGKKVIELNHIHKSYGEKKCIDDFTYIVLRNDRVGIVGPNGMGKSTLLNIMAEKIQPDHGTIERGETVKIGYFSQESTEMEDSLRVIDYIRNEAEYITNGEGMKITASQMLERFLFPPHVQWTPIEKLSGGEKRRLYLLKVLMSAPNVIFLDEPTNDLDIKTLTILEDYLEEFQGAVIVVSHDRYFLDKITDKIFAFEGNGMIKQYTGNYSEYEESVDQKRISSNNEKSNKNIEKKKNKVENKPKKLKFTFKEQREYDQIDEMIEKIEEKLDEINEKINHAGSDFELLQKCVSEKEALEKELEEKIERWEYLNELAERIEEEKGR
ncbi:ABC-F family ATP-binding cassette domain-containing protein [Crassaminicella profunda]|uniref:ABC-F family ATP-binding cassette domain-containing protein n=1 Tax=Crassaminicella profunda TaxID=1286698 RepID=UPI001CA65A96|nr:ABC-F family ATP-binding cassette domain-containing protein [Crassaminicella profunda]QZY54484.1 ABC-F family ATP-binding cassette domain-containing protein [Crassaminicella profunda]